MTPKPWRIRLGRAAEMDFANILRYTRDSFGLRQAEIYKSLLIDALGALEAGPELPGSTSRDEILPGLRSLHVARRGRPGRHFILYRAAEGEVTEVLRILHDAMDLARHVPSADGR
jgi:toxin ParE1/3/4